MLRWYSACFAGIFPVFEFFAEKVFKNSKNCANLVEDFCVRYAEAGLAGFRTEADPPYFERSPLWAGLGPTGGRIFSLFVHCDPISQEVVR